MPLLVLTTEQAHQSAKHMPPPRAPAWRIERAFDARGNRKPAPISVGGSAAHWSMWRHGCVRLKQGFHQNVTRLRRLGTALALLVGQVAQAQATCPADAPTLRSLGPALWQVAGTAGDANATNRGRTDNLLVLQHDHRVWLLGSGASPAAGRALACILRERLGWRVTDVVNPWARPEVVLGNAAFTHGATPTRLWAHADVAQAMQRQCPRCVERLHLRLGSAAADLGPSPIVLPRTLLQGEHGTLGPWQWWRLERAPGSVVTVWHLRDTSWWWAPGLLWSDGPPDLRDSSAPALAQAIERLMALAAAIHSAPQWLPTQGAPLNADDVQAQHTYLVDLPQRVQQQQDRGALETDPPASPPGPAYLAQGERASLNWQRVWRHVESAAWSR